MYDILLAMNMLSGGCEDLLATLASNLLFNIKKEKQHAHQLHLG